MVAGRSSGGSIGGVGGAARGSSGIGSRGGGIESRGGFSGGKSFGNTARFESSFSGRSLATMSRPRTESRTSHSFGPRVEAVKSHSLDTHRPGMSPWSTTRTLYSRESRPSGIQRSQKTATQLFGPRLEAVRTRSVDSHRPKVSAFKETRPIYVSNADAKYHAQPGHSKFHTEPKSRSKGKELPRVSAKSFGPKLEVTRVPSPGTRQSHELWTKNTAILYSRSEQTPNTSRHSGPLRRSFSEASKVASGDRIQNLSGIKASEIKKFSVINTETRPQQQNRQHSLQQSTRELNLHTDRPQTPSAPRFTYERIQPNIDPAKQHINISPTGEMKVNKGKVDSSARWQNAMQEKSQKSFTKQATKAETEKITKSDGYQKIAQKAADSANQKSNLMHGTESLPVQSQTQLEKQITEDIRAPHWQITRPAEIQKSPVAMKEVNPRQTQNKVVTQTETQKVLDTYVEQMRQKKGADEIQSKAAQVKLADITSEETKADIEQAARVMQAYKDVWPEQAEKAVIAALDQKLAKQGLQETVMPQVQEQPMISPYELPVSAPEASTQTAAVEQPQIPVILPALAPQTETTVTTTVQPAVQAETQTDEAVATATATDTQLQLMTQTSQPSTLPVQQITETDEELEEEEEEEEKEASEQKGTLLMREGAFERDKKRDQYRYDLAVDIAELVANNNPHARIPGKIFLYVMSQPVLYEKMQSEIAPGPDEYLTELIEELSEYDYESVGEVKAKVDDLISKKPAILIGDIPSVTEDDVRHVRNSVRYPKSL